MGPLLIAPLFAALGAVLGWRAARNYAFFERRRRLALSILLTMALAAAIVPNVGQSLYDLGLTFQRVELLETGSFLLFGFAIAACWGLLLRSPTRWLLLILLLVAFAPLALWVYAFTVWGMFGFAP